MTPADRICRKRFTMDERHHFTSQLLTLFLGLTLFLALAAAEVLATTVERNDKVVISFDEIIDDDLVVFGGTCRLEGSILGDALLVSESIRGSGNIEGSSLMFSRTVSFTGKINHSLGVFCQNAFLDGVFSGSVYAFAETVEIGSEAEFERDITVFCERLFFEGKSAANLKAECETAIISGVIVGDIYLTAKKVEILETALIEGDLILTDVVDLTIEDESVVAGEVIQKKTPVEEGSGSSWIPWLVFILLAFLIVGVIVLALFREHYQLATASLGGSFPKALAYGVLTFGGGLICCMILAFTVIGIFASMLIGSVLALFITMLGQIYLSGGIGSLIISRGQTVGFGLSSLRLLVGLVILLTLVFVLHPFFLGVLAFAVAGIIGLGMAVLALQQARQVDFPSAPLSPSPSPSPSPSSPSPTSKPPSSSEAPPN